jgi:hypothetical protein
LRQKRTIEQGEHPLRVQEGQGVERRSFMVVAGGALAAPDWVIE